MKKIILAIATLLTLTIFSCASDSVEDPQDNIEEITAPEVTDLNDSSETLSLKKLPEPEDFEEPVVRDLDISFTDDYIEPAVAVVEKPQEPVKAVESSVNNTAEAQTESLTANAANSSVSTVKTDAANTSSSTLKPDAANTSNSTSKTDAANTSSSTSKPDTANTPSSTLKPDAANTSNSTSKPVAANTPSSTSKTNTANNLSSTEKPEETKTSEAVEQNTQPKLDTKPVEIIPSRKVTVNTNETLSITYPGYGWIYLGSESENNNLVSTGRKVENEETVYTLTAKNSGTQLQHFYKVDTITGSFIDDYIEVEVLDNKGSVYTIVKAPDYGQVVPERPVVPAVASTNRPLTQDEILEKAITPTEKRNFIEYTPEPEPAKKVVEEKSIYSKTPDSYIENLDADDLLAKAKELFSQEKFVESQKYLNNFMEVATEKRDEGLFLQGQIFEQDGATKNIKESISSYTTLTESYPESIYWDDAKKRIIYLNRFYIQIR